MFKRRQKEMARIEIEIARKRIEQERQELIRLQYEEIDRRYHRAHIPADIHTIFSDVYKDEIDAVKINIILERFKNIAPWQHLTYKELIEDPTLVLHLWKKIDALDDSVVPTC